MMRFRTMRAAPGCMATLLVFVALASGCGENDAPGTPEDAVKGMLDAVKEQNYAKASTYVDIEGILASAKQRMEDESASLPEDMKADWRREIDSTGTDHITRQVLDQMSESADDVAFTYEILDTEYHGDDSATVKVGITDSRGKTETRELPVVKADGIWKIGLRHDDGGDSARESSAPSEAASETK